VVLGRLLDAHVLWLQFLLVDVRRAGLSCDWLSYLWSGTRNR